MGFLVDDEELVSFRSGDPLSMSLTSRQSLTPALRLNEVPTEVTLYLNGEDLRAGSSRRPTPTSASRSKMHEAGLCASSSPTLTPLFLEISRSNWLLWEAALLTPTTGFVYKTWVMVDPTYW